jgi:hypothetical protein
MPSSEPLLVPCAAAPLTMNEVVAVEHVVSTVGAKPRNNHDALAGAQVWRGVGKGGGTCACKQSHTSGLAWQH